MEFYEQLSKYYDDIFPTSENTVDFIASVAGESPKNVLDVACGTGGHSLGLAKRGYKMTSTDLDENMILELKLKAQERGLDVNSEQGDMLNITFANKFDVIFCIGNSIVHLSSKEEIVRFFLDAYGRLNEDGKFIVQVVNFDKILMPDYMVLPLIQNYETGIKFERRYKNAENGKVVFATTLSVDNSFEKFVAENEIQLTPLCSNEIVDMLGVAGFSRIELFGDFNRTEYFPGISNAIVAVASK